MTGTLRDLEKCFGKWRQKTKIKPIEPRLTFGFYDVKFLPNTSIPTSKAKDGGGFVRQEQTGSVGSLVELVKDVRQNGAKDRQVPGKWPNHAIVPSQTNYGKVRGEGALTCNGKTHTTLMEV